MGSHSGDKAPSFRLNDLHAPNILPILGVPTVPPPPRDFYEDEVDPTGSEKPSAATLDAVINLLGEADVSKLRPLDSPKLRPEKPTALLLALQAKSSTIFDLQKGSHATTTVQQRRRSSKRAAEVPPIVSPAPNIPAPPPGGSTPGTSSAERNRRSRSSLKLSIAATEKPALAPTMAEEATSIAHTLIASLENFSRCHADLINQDGEGEGNEEQGTNGKTEDEAGDRSGSAGGGASGCSSPAHRLLTDIRKLGDVSVRACAMAGALEQVPRDTLSQALRVLRAATERGRHTLLEEEEEEEESSPHVASALAALEAVVTALRLSVAASTTKLHVVSEEVLEAAVDATRFQLQHNVLPFHDARLRAATRPDLGATPSAAEAMEEDAAPPPVGGDGAGPSKPATSKVKAKGVGGKSKNNATQQLGLQIPSALNLVTDRIQSVLSLLCELLPAVKVPTAMLIPLLRSSVASITVPSLPALQTKAAALMAAAFRSHLDLRKTILDELFTHAAPYLGTTAKSLKRDFTLAEGVHSSTGGDAGGGGGGGSKSIQVFTAAVLQMIQGCAELPPQDASTTDIMGAFGHPVKAADYFWAQCLDRLPMARTHKAETDHDFTALLQGVVADLVVASALPEWPAAGTLLLRLAATINSQRGLQHTDPVVRQSCVDLLGRLLATVHASEAAATDDREWLEGVTLDNGFEDATQAAQELLLKYLSDRHHSSSTSASIARRFWVVRSLSETATAAMHGHTEEESSELDKEQVQAALLDSRIKLDELDAMVYDTGVDASDAARLMQQALRAAFTRAAPAMLSWLLEMLDPRAQAPTTRAKAVKALADLAAADPAVLGMPAVQAAVERSLGDDSISVREASLNLLGRHMAGDPELSLSLLDTVIKAVDDPGASVRKCAIKILKESAIAVPGFPRATDACCALLLRASDSEESVQNAVAKVFHALWFSPQVESADGSTVLKRSLEERAAQLADVAAAAYDAGGASIHLPMDSQTPLVGVLRAALGWEARGDLHLEWKAGRQIAEALLESILSEQHLRRGADDGNEDGEDEDSIRPALLALHALAITDADFCLPEKNPQKFLRALAPYLKAAPDSQYTTEVDRRNAAERLLCVLSVVESVLSQLDHLNDNLGALADVPGDLVFLINQHRYTQVVAAACKCLAALAQRSTAAAARLVQVAHVYYKWLQSPGEHSQANLPRFLFIIGQLCRHGSQVIDRAAVQTPGTVSVPACLVTFGQYWRYNGPAALKEQVQRCALEATGQLAIARPLTMVQTNSDARRMLDAALKREASSGFKMAALSSLTELLQADAESLERRQKVQLATTPGTATGAAGNGSSGRKRAAAGLASAKKKKRRKKSFANDEVTDEEEEFVPRSTTVVATENGEGDSLSQSSAVLQQHWDAVLVLATDSGAAATAAAAGVSSAAAARIAADGIAIRRRVIALMDVVLRDGLVGPWTAVPALVALSSDGVPDIANRALRLLCELAEKHPQYVDAGRLTAGLEQAYKLHCGSEPQQNNNRTAATPRKSNPIAPSAVLAALGGMYSRLVWSSRPRRNDFLRALLRQYRVVLGSGVAAGRADVNGAPLRLLAFIAAVAGALPFRRAEEACIIIQEAAGICASHADAVLVELHSVLGAGEQEEEEEENTTRVPDAESLAAPCRAAAALCMLYRLRARMERAYSISPERAAAFDAAGKRKTAEESLTVSIDPTAPPLQLGDLDLGTAVDAMTARQLMVELEESHGGVGEDDVEEAE